jgi:hypothetical protein
VHLISPWKEGQKISMEELLQLKQLRNFTESNQQNDGKRYWGVPQKKAGAFLLRESGFSDVKHHLENVHVSKVLWPARTQKFSFGLEKLAENWGWVPVFPIRPRISGN